MIKKMTCIECPQGCQLIAEVENGYLIKLSGQKCTRGEEYAKQEIENPLRILTSAVLTKGLSVKMVPVRTNKPIPKAKLIETMEEIKRICLERPVKVGEIIAKDLLGLGVDLVATRDVF